jgi:alanine-glyoxylate transaminase/serine-glyoxylate transaminase/serine-pyruvate transaminase
MPRGYFDWRPMLESNAGGWFPFTPATNMLRGLREALAMLQEEGLANVFARHARHGAAARAAAAAWGLDLQCAEPRDVSAAVTTVRMPEGHGADALRAVILRRFNMSLGSGLGQLKDVVFRIGHLGDLSDLSLVGALGGVEMGLALAGVPHRAGGAQAALAVLAEG